MFQLNRTEVSIEEMLDRGRQGSMSMLHVESQG